MKYQIRESDTQENYFYLISIDDDGNQTFIADANSAEELKQHESIQGQKVEVVAEELTRGLVQTTEEE